jgi:hypothetical protein
MRKANKHNNAFNDEELVGGGSRGEDACTR